MSIWKLFGASLVLCCTTASGTGAAEGCRTSAGCRAARCEPPQSQRPRRPPSRVTAVTVYQGNARS